MKYYAKMKNLFIILIALFLTSCMTVKRVEKNCDLFAKICIVESEKTEETTTTTETETKFRDTTIIVYIPEKKVKDDKPVMIVDKQRKPIPVKKESVNSALSVLVVPFARSYAKVVNSRLKHELIQTDTILLFELENALKDRKTLETKITSLKQIKHIPIKENTKFAKFTIKWFFGTIVFIILASGFLILRFKSKILGLFK